jgi:hypothetical protein
MPAVDKTQADKTKATKLIAEAGQLALSLTKSNEAMLTACLATRSILSTLTLHVGQIEHLTLSQSRAKRKSDEMLLNAEDALAAALKKLEDGKGVMTMTQARTDAGVKKLVEQAARMTDVPLRDPAPKQSREAPGVEYVALGYICQRLSTPDRQVSEAYVRKEVEKKKLPKNDAVRKVATSKRPIMVWVKRDLDRALVAYLASRREAKKRAEFSLTAL